MISHAFAMRVITLGRRAFTSGFMLAGVTGVEVEDSSGALKQIRMMIEDKEVGLIIISDEISKPIRDDLTEIRSAHPVPLIYEIPAPGSKQERVEYREMIKKVLKMG